MSVWLLPENIADMLPREARAIEHLRSSFLKLVTSHGFEVVRPPLAVSYTHLGTAWTITKDAV